MANRRSSRFEGRGLSYNRPFPRSRLGFDDVHSASTSPLGSLDEMRNQTVKNKKIDKHRSPNDLSTTVSSLYINNGEIEGRDGYSIRSKTLGLMPQEDDERRRKQKSKVKGRQKGLKKSRPLAEAITTDASGNPIESMLFFAISNDDLKLVRREV